MQGAQMRVEMKSSLKDLKEIPRSNERMAAMKTKPKLARDSANEARAKRRASRSEASTSHAENITTHAEGSAPKAELLEKYAAEQLNCPVSHCPVSREVAANLVHF